MKSFFRIIPKICLILTILIGCEIAESDELFNQGTGLLREGQYDQAIALFSEAIEINPRNADAYHNRGLAYALKGQLEKATSDLNKAIELDPRYDKKAWLEKHEDILSVLQKSLSLHQTEVNKEIFTNNAI